MDNWVKDLRYILMPCRQPVKGFEKEYQETYRVWRTAWEKFRNEIGAEAKLNSDGFLLPDEMGVLFYKDECVGLTSYGHGPLDGPLQDLGWFNAWTPEALKALQNISNDVIVCSQFTVNPKFAGKDQIVRWKDILSLYSFMRFENSDAGVVAGHLNLTRGMQNACGETFGATVLEPNHTFNYYGVEIPAMLVAYERHVMRNMIEQKQLTGLCNDLWTRLVHLSEFPAQKKVLQFKKTA